MPRRYTVRHMTPLRCAVVGAGYLGRFHAQKYAALDECELVGIADTAPEARARLAAELGVAAFEDHRGLLGLVDAVSIATPTSLHHAVARDFLVAGLDPAAMYSPSTIEAPVFAPDGAIALGLVLVGLPRTMSGAEIEAMAGRLVAATSALSASLR